MKISQWWLDLTVDSREWLIEHNGESLAPEVRDDIFRAAGGESDPTWWSGDSVDGSSELTDEATDWIEATANGE